MDEMWQRHKAFIVQVLIGGVLFLVAFFVMRGMYGDQNDPAAVRERNLAKKAELEKRASAGRAPSSVSITKQREQASTTDANKWELARRVASVAGRDDKLKDAERVKAYVAENVELTLKNIGVPDQGVLALFDTLPQACLSRLRDLARTSVIGRAAQTGKDVDESLGLGAYPDDEIPQALHGLAIVTDVVGRCLARPGIERVLSLRITAQSQFPEVNGVTFMDAIGVHFEVVGDPADVAEVIRSFNSVGRKDQRMVVLESIEYITPPSPDEDTVKASINVVGLRYEAKMQAGGN